MSGLLICGYRYKHGRDVQCMIFFLGVLKKFFEREVKEASGLVELRVVCKKLDMDSGGLDFRISHLAGLIYDKG